jgi:preprotein translocase subunit SecF
MQILKYKKIFFWFSGILMGLSLYFVIVDGLNFGVDFTGGSILEVQNTEKQLQKAEVERVLIENNISNVVVRESDDHSFIMKTRTLDEDTKNKIVLGLGEKTEVKRFNTVGPTLGNELKTKAVVALIIVIMAITFFIAYAFRHVSTPVSSWKYGFATMIALIHDVIITVGVFAFLGQFGYEVDPLFITALLVILGYSINDTIVVFDRVRDNLNQLDENKREKEFENVLNNSFKETLVRSANTSFTTLLALFVLFFMNIEVIKGFVLALIVGIISGTYSSIFLALPVLSLFKRSSRKS